MKIESNKNWTTCLRLNTGDGSPRVFLLNSHFLGSVPFFDKGFFLFTASSFNHFNMNKWHGCASLRFELVYIVALWFYFTPKWEGGASKSLTPCGVELGLTGLQNFAL